MWVAAALEHPHHRAPARRARAPICGIAAAAALRAVEVAEQLVGPVDQVNDDRLVGAAAHALPSLPRCAARRVAPRIARTGASAANAAPRSWSPARSAGRRTSPATGSAGPAARPSTGRGTAAGAPRRRERRMVSVLFADLVGFTPLSEDARPGGGARAACALLRGRARRSIERYGGTVEKFIGDAVMAVWGAPVAHEDDAERAVRAALELVAAVAALGEDVGRRAAARAGVLTGEAAVTVGADGQGMVAGDLVNTASRIQAVAAAGHGVGRRGDPPRDRGGDRLRGRRRAPAEGQGRAGRLWRAMHVVAARRGEAPLAGPGAAVRRAGRASCGCSRSCCTRPAEDAARAGGRRRHRAGSASRGCPGSSRSTSTGWPTTSSGIAAGAFPTATGSRSGRWPRWSASLRIVEEEDAETAPASSTRRSSEFLRAGRAALRGAAPRAAARARDRSRAGDRDRPVPGLAAVLRADADDRSGRAGVRGPAVGRQRAARLHRVPDGVVAAPPDLRAHAGPAGARRAPPGLGAAARD